MEMHLRAVNEIILCFSVKSVVPVSSSSYENQSSKKSYLNCWLSAKSVVPVSSSSFENESSIKKFYFASF